jgi:hypothetical protein
MRTLNALALGYAGAVLSALCMFMLGVVGRMGFYMNAVEQMQDWHVFFSLSAGGIIGGMIEAAVYGFIILWAFGWLYNMFVTKRG